MADEKAPSGGGSPYSGSPFYQYVETNTVNKPYVYYNLGVYVTLYNRIRGDLQNNFDGDLSTFDTVINDKIRKGLSGDKAHVEAFLQKYNCVGLVKTYDTPEEEADAKENKDYDYNVSSSKFSADFEKTVALARKLAMVKYGAKDKRMLTYDDAREIMLIKEEKSDKMFYESNRKLLTNVGGLDDKGKMAGGPLTQAVLKAETKLKGMKKNLRIGRLKALGLGALVLGAGALTGGLGFATLGLGGSAISGLFGALYTTSSAAATLGGVVATGVSGFVTYKGFGGFMARLGQNWKDRKKLSQFKYSRGKYAEANDDEWDKMGYARVKQTYKEQVAISEFYKNYSSGKCQTKSKLDKEGKLLAKYVGKLEPADYVSDKYKKYFNKYIAKQEEYLGPKARDASVLFSNAQHHKFVYNQELKPGEMGYHNLYRFMTHGVEGYETSDLTADEVILNYGVGTADNGTKQRLHPDAIKEHKNFPDELSYITARLKEYEGYEETFKKKGALGEYAQGLGNFVRAYNNSFNNSLFENAYTPRIITDASNIVGSDEFQSMVKATNEGTTEAHLKSVISFLSAEQENNQRPVKVLSDSVGVGVEHQIDMSEKSLKKGCETLGDTSPEAQAAVSAIASMATCSVKPVGGAMVREIDPAVKVLVDLVPNAKTKRYLTHIMQSKLEGCKVTSSPYVSTLRGAERTNAEAFANQIYGISSSEKANEIRTKIAASSALSVDAKAKLNAILDTQVSGLETTIRDEARVEAIKGVKHGSVKFSELVEEIDKIKSFKKDELHDLWIKIERVDDANLFKYLELRFKDKVTKELIEFTETSKNFGGEEANAQTRIQALKNFLRDVRDLCSEKGDKFIDEWQLQKCISALSVQVETTFKSYLDDLKNNFLIDTDKKKQTLNELINQPMPIGIKEFFDEKTPESEAILERAKRFTLSADVYSFMTVPSIGGYRGLVDADSQDSRDALSIYFKQTRPSDDVLNKLFQRLNADINNTEINSNNPDIISALPELDNTNPSEDVIVNGEAISFPKFASPAGGNYKCKLIIKDSNGGYDFSVPAGQIKKSFLYSTLETLKSPDFVNAPADERLATLLILRKKIAGMARVQMIRLYRKRGSSLNAYSDFVQMNKTDLDNNLATNWKSVAMVVDKLIDNAKNHLLPEDKENYNKVSITATSDAVEAICHTIDQYETKIQETKVFGA